MTTEPPEPTLAGMTVEAIRRLGRNRRGFFLLVEGSLIDSRATIISWKRPSIKP